MSMANFYPPRYTPPKASPTHKPSDTARLDALEAYVQTVVRELQYVLSHLDDKNFHNTEKGDNTP